MAQVNPMQVLYKRLAASGINRKYVQDVALPEWWSDDVAGTQAGYADALGLISSHLGIPLELLWDTAKPVICPEAGNTKFKKSAGVSDDELKWPRCIALSAAQHALAVFPRPFSPLPPDPRTIRSEIRANGHRWVSLEGLLDYLWAHGLPVLHINQFPKGKKMAGLAAKVRGRPVIIVSKNHPFPSLMLFDIVHELGHITCGHVEDTVIFDAKISRLTEKEKDPDEIAANKAASLVLMGAERNYVSRGRLTAAKLAQAAMDAAIRDQVDPGIIAQNFGYGVDFFPVANAACKILEGEAARPIELVRQKMKEHLRLDAMSDDDREFFMSVAAGGSQDALPLRQ